MKNIFTLLLILSVSFSYSQLDEGQKINFDFIKVEKENIERGSTINITTHKN